ncbi:hypothetical protein PR048_005090 [Dryococelus australis]|uniref:Reverse transcriptase n=1 Tax=Dryococelus australis TaxID=614101 RepID=A0ABQ9I899_9NEOP|nr:hypothetical protein PR048_005090 [Dryococelus australis]
MDAFGDIDGVMIYVDDLLIYTADEQTNDRIHKQVLHRYKVQEVKYVGDSLKVGNAIPAKVKSLQPQIMTPPRVCKMLQRFLGLIN